MKKKNSNLNGKHYDPQSFQKYLNLIILNIPPEILEVANSDCGHMY